MSLFPWKEVQWYTASLHKCHQGAKLKHNCMFCFDINAANKDGSSLQTPHGERKCFGCKSKGFFERRKKREVHPFIKLSLPSTPSTFSCWLMSPFQSHVTAKNGAQKMWVVQRSHQHQEEDISKYHEEKRSPHSENSWVTWVTGKEMRLLDFNCYSHAAYANFLLKGALYWQLNTRVTF